MMNKNILQVVVQNHSRRVPAQSYDLIEGNLNVLNVLILSFPCIWAQLTGGTKKKKQGQEWRVTKCFINNDVSACTTRTVKSIIKYKLLAGSSTLNTTLVYQIIMSKAP